MPGPPNRCAGGKASLSAPSDGEADMAAGTADSTEISSASQAKASEPAELDLKHLDDAAVQKFPESVEEAAAGMVAEKEEGEQAEDDEELLTAKEAELTSEVPMLLESMNRASGEVNTLERQVGEAQGRYRQLLEQWSRLYEEMRSQYGSAIDRARPYFDAAQALSLASQRVQAVVREFSAAASQHSQAKADLRAIEERLAYGAHKVTLDRDQQSGLSSATVRVLRCQQERDRREQEYARALRDYQDAQEVAETRRAQVGDSAIRRALPCFRQLQQHQNVLATEQNRINVLNERIRSAKSLYNSSMKGLDRINIAVHTARRDLRESRVSSPSVNRCSSIEPATPDGSPAGAGSEETGTPAVDSSGTADTSEPSSPCKAKEVAPEVSPETEPDVMAASKSSETPAGPAGGVDESW
mmetsp:Transcript_15458/g.27680  ORF Transcript_15458/g.27680 Transcript_15458/m.27680 type:complete len:414 (-) Transcript_15458:1-1242(-)